MVKAVLFEAQGGEDRFPCWAAGSFTLVSEGEKPIR